MNWRRFRGKCFAAWQVLNGRLYYSGSQAGEDQLARYLLFSCLGIDKPTYIDIGANHPFMGSNTFYFYSRGSRGVCVEPDPSFYHLLKKYRRHDTVLQVGIGLENTAEADLYVFPGQYAGWNTFSKEEADDRVKQSGIAIQKVLKVPLLNINELIQKHLGAAPNFLSLDVEGLDLDILRSLDYTRHRPEVICVESITFSVTNQEQKITEIAAFMQSKGYFVFGDTHVNTIFCDTEAFRKLHP